MAEVTNGEHSHEHTHTYTHTHEHSHADGDTHNHEHSHEHGSSVGEMSDADKLVKLLSHMKEHNEHHTSEVGRMAENAAALGKDQAAELLKKASLIYDEANALLSEALKLL